MAFNTYSPTQEELIANAPEGATHYTEENEDWYLTYWKYEPLTDKWVHRTANSSWWNDAYSCEFDELKAKGLVKSIEEGVLVEPSEDDPISIRNRILEIRKQRFDGIDEEEKLVNQLAALGFQIIEQMNQKLDDVKEQHEVVVEGMDDFRNWEKGDIVTFVAELSHTYSFTKGKNYIVDSIDLEDDNSVLVTEDDSGYRNGWKPAYFQFHSRPSK
jgi:hypothetical protein